MIIRDLLPFIQAPVRQSKKTAQIIDVDDRKVLAKVFKVAALALGFESSTGSSASSRTTFEISPYDFDRIIQAIDTDSYVKQAFNKYRELLWKGGWDIISENSDAASYLYQRIDFIELATGRPFRELLSDIGDQVVKYGNCFLAKSRGDLGPYFPGKLKGLDGGDPIVGYYLVPIETMEVARDSHNKVMKYRQNIDDTVWAGPRRPQRAPEWKPEEMIHFYYDRKPGHIFGTPFFNSAVDDVVALRQVEEDIQNLVHRELFPLYKYRVGTEEHPTQPGELEDAAVELANLRTEGGLLLPDRHDVEVIGADGNALEANDYLQHFKERVVVGLGLAPHHLGMLMNGGNRAVTDRLDIALYDKVKSYQRYLRSMIEIQIFNELLLEGGYDPFVHPSLKSTSDRCSFEFNEIDKDSQIKVEANEVQKFAANISTLTETRLALGLKPEVDEEDLLMALTARFTPQTSDPGQPKISTKPGATYPGGGAPGGTGATALPTGKATPGNKPDAAKSSAGGVPNLPTPSKGAGNIIRPSNQHGRRTSPDVRHMDDELLSSRPDETLLEEIVNLLDD